jgi:hypothetical protein
VICPFPDVDNFLVLYAVESSFWMDYNWNDVSGLAYDDGSMGRFNRISSWEFFVRSTCLSSSLFGFKVGDILMLESVIIFDFRRFRLRCYVRWKKLTRLRGLLSQRSLRFFWRYLCRCCVISRDSMKNGVKLFIRTMNPLPSLFLPRLRLELTLGLERLLEQCWYRYRKVSRGLRLNYLRRKRGRFRELPKSPMPVLLPVSLDGLNSLRVIVRKSSRWRRSVVLFSEWFGGIGPLLWTMLRLLRVWFLLVRLKIPPLRFRSLDSEVYIFLNICFDFMLARFALFFYSYSYDSDMMRPLTLGAPIDERSSKNAFKKFNTVAGVIVGSFYVIRSMISFCYRIFICVFISLSQVRLRLCFFMKFRLLNMLVESGFNSDRRGGNGPRILSLVLYPDLLQG